MGILNKTEKKAQETEDLRNLWGTNSVSAAEKLLQSTNEKIQSIENDLRTKTLTETQRNDYIEALNSLKESKIIIENAIKTGDYFSLLNYEDANLLKENLEGNRGFFRDDYNQKDLSEEELYKEFAKNTKGKTGKTKTKTKTMTTGQQTSSVENELYSLEDIIGTDIPTTPASEPEPTPAPAAAKPAATAGGGQTGRVTAAMKPAEFKPKYLEEIEPKSEEEYLGKDPNNWKTMSKAEKAAKAIGFIGDIGGDVIDTIAAGYGLENGGAKRLREAREKLQRDKEERQAQYRDYVNKIEAENRRIREFNAGIGNQLAFQQFQAENEYNRQLNLLNEQARLQRENGLYNTPL